jgi:hypothetical protein
MQPQTLAIATALVFLGAGFLTAQQPAVDSAIRVSVDLVQVDVTVTDSKGKHIADCVQKSSKFRRMESSKRSRIFRT